nr:unnamed protein product [Spirometra erinaceieuropaei]
MPGTPPKAKVIVPSRYWQKRTTKPKPHISSPHAEKEGCEPSFSIHRAIDSQIVVLGRLESILRGAESEDQSGLIALLRNFSEASLLPARQRLPTSGLIYASEEEVVSIAKLAKIAQDKFSGSISGELQGLKDLSRQLKKVSDLINSQSSVYEIENYAKLKEAYRLLTYLVSLKTQKLQSELLKLLSSQFT